MGELKVLSDGTVYVFTGGSSGMHMSAGSSGWVANSDRNMKENFVPVDTRQVLDGVAAMPMTTWNYKTDPKATRHLGPMAQDFWAAYRIGEDDKHINEIDEQGVALAAIQGLNQKLEQTVKEKDDQIVELRREMAELKATVRKVSEQVEQSKAAPQQAANIRQQGGM
jgi:hypothetical protein